MDFGFYDKEEHIGTNPHYHISSIFTVSFYHNFVLVGSRFLFIIYLMIASTRAKVRTGAIIRYVRTSGFITKKVLGSKIMIHTAFAGWQLAS